MQNRTERLFRKYRETGDARALGAVFDRTAPELLRVAVHLTRDPHRAEDLLQSTFLTAMEGASQYDGKRPLLPWLLGILANRARMWRRSERSSLELPPELTASPDSVEGSGVPDRLAERELAEVCGRALDGMPEPYRHVLILHLRHGLSGTEIATALDRPASTVRNQIARGMNLLRQALPAIGASIAAISVSGGRGLAAVRAAVLAEVPVATVAAAAAPSLHLLGAFLMNKTAALLLGITLVAAAGWNLREPRALMPTGPEPGALVAIPTGIDTHPAQDNVATPATGAERTSASAVIDKIPVAATLIARAVYVGETEPASGLAYKLWQWEGQRKAKRRSGLTDSDGALVEQDLEPGDYILDLALGGEADQIWIRMGAGERIEKKLEVLRGWSLTGVVLDPEGRPVEGAEIRKEDDAGLPVTLARTGVDGAFHATNLRGTFKLWASATGRQPTPQKRVEEHAEAHVRLVLGERGCVLNGSVEEEPGRPAAHAIVSIGVPLDLGSPFIQRRQFTVQANERGTFQLDWLPPGNLFVGALPADGDRVRATASWVDVTDEGPARVRLRLGETGRIVGRVNDAEGAAVPGATLHASHQGETGLGTFGWRIVEAGEDGRYELEGLIPGSYRVWAERGSISQETQIEVEVGREHTWDVRLASGTTLTIRVLDPEGEPVASRLIEVQTESPEMGWLRADTARTDAEGLCEFEDLKPTVHRVIGYTGDLFALAFRRDDIFPGTDEVVVQLTADEVPTATIHGRIVDAAGTPVSLAQVTLSQDGWSRMMPLTLQEDGTFTSGSLVPGSYGLSARAAGDGQPYATALVDELSAGEDHDIGDLVLIEPGQLEVSLSAVDGKPVTEPVLQLVPRGMISPGGIELEWDGVDNVYRSSGLNPGDYALTFFAADAMVQTLDLELRAGKTRRIDLTVERGQPVVLDLRYPAENSTGSGLLNGAIVVTDAGGTEVVSRRLFGYFDDFEERIEHIRLALGTGTYSVTASDYWTKKVVELEIEVSGRASGPVEIDLR